jgi:hypothetical protein
MRLIKYLLLILPFSFIISTSVASAAPTSRSLIVKNNLFATNATTDACAALNSLDASNNCSAKGGNTTVNNLVSNVVKIIGILIGVVSVIMIMFSGFKFITANGDPQAVSNARNTLIYAIIGIVVAVLAEFLVSRVLGTASNITSVNIFPGLTDHFKILSNYG